MLPLFRRGQRVANSFSMPARAARFAAKYDFDLSGDLLNAMRNHKDSLSKVSQERISTELMKIIELDDPSHAIEILIGLKVLEECRTDILDWLITWESPVSIPLRFAALFCEWNADTIGAKMRALRFPNKLIYSVKRIADLYPKSFWARTDKEIRQLVMSAGNDLEDTLKLADATYPYFGGMSVPKIDRIREIAENEDLSNPLDGKEIMFLLDITSGPVIGEAVDEMRDYIAENGPTSKLIMGNHLLNWYTMR